MGKNIQMGTAENPEYPRTLAEDVFFKKGQSLKDRVSDVIVVDASGNGDYTDLQEAINNAGDTEQHPKTIIVMKGTYVMPTATDKSVHRNRRFISIIGVSRNDCIIRNDKGIYTNSPSYEDNAPIKLMGKVLLKNLTIISTKTKYSGSELCTSYCVHFDYLANINDECVIDNCTLENDHYACVGIGMACNVTIRNSSLKTTAPTASTYGGTIYAHNQSVSGTPTLRLEYNLIVNVGSNTNMRIGYSASFSGGCKVEAAYNRCIGGNVSISPEFKISEFSYGNNVNELNYYAEG